jgi:hypothetical protein
MSTEDPQKYEAYKAYVWFNQARINYELVQVNRKVIEALNTLVKLLQEDRSAHGLGKVDLTGFEALITKAGQIATDVASIDPPGCQGPPPY